MTRCILDGVEMSEGVCGDRGQAYSRFVRHPPMRRDNNKEAPQGQLEEREKLENSLTSLWYSYKKIGR